MLRSIPCGRSGLANGSSPAAIRSVQLAKFASDTFVSCLPNAAAIFTIACPDWTRRSQASTEVLNVPSADGIARVALLPSWWQPGDARDPIGAWHIQDLGD